MSRVLLAFVAVSFIFFIGCAGGGDGNAQESVNDIRPGSFTISQVTEQLNNIKSSRIQSNTSGSVTFECGHIQASLSLYFLLGNSGTLPITNVTVTSSNSNFTVSPSSFNRIDGLGSGSIIPILKVFVNHGNSVSGIGFTPPLAMGATESTIVIKGQTTDINGEPLEVSLSALIKVFADYVDFDLISDGNVKPFSSPDGATAGDSIGDGVFSVYNCVSPQVKNTGNSKISIDCLNDGFNMNYSLIQRIDILPGETKHLVFNPERKGIICRVNVFNTVFNRSKVKMHTDGYIYFRVDKLN